MVPAVAQGPSADASTVEVIVASADSEGDIAAAHLNRFVRTYTADGSRDATSTKKLEMRDGLLSTAAGARALPVALRVRTFLDGAEVAPRDLKGKSGDIRVEWTVTNRTAKTQELTYTDSASGASRTVTALTVLPLTVTLTGVHLPDASFDSLKTNGVAAHKGDATDVSWTAVLAPPLFPATSTFSIEGRTNNFALSGADLTAAPGIAGALPAAVRDAKDKGGASTATLLGYIQQFGDGFGDLGAGLGQIKGGVDQIFEGINGKLKPGLRNDKFDAALFKEDSTLASNQPGLVQALAILADGLGSLKDGVAKVRAGLKTGDAANPGVAEGLALMQSSIGEGNEFDGAGNPLTLRASLNAMRAGLVSGDASAPKILEGLQQIVAAIGQGNEFSGTTPLTLRASINAIRAALASGDPLNPKIIEGLEQIYSSIGNGTEFAGTTPLTVAAGLAAARGALSSGNPLDPKIIEGLEQIYASIGNGTEFAGTTPLSLAASLAAARAALSSGNPADPKIIEGLQQVYDGLGNGTEFAGTTPLTVRASLNAMRAALQSGNPAQPGLVEGVQQVIAGLTLLDTNLAGLDTNFTTLVNNALLGALLPPLDLGQSAVVAGVLHAAVGNGTEFAGDGTPLTLRAAVNALKAGLSSGDITNPRILEGLQKLFAGIGDGTEFSGATPLTVAASLVAMRGALVSGDPLNPRIIEGLQKIYDGIGTGSEFSGTTPLTMRAGLNAIRAGLSSGDPLNPRIIEGLEQIYAAIGTGAEFSGTTPLTLRAGLNAIREGLKSGNPADPRIIEGLQQIRAALGDGTEFTGTTPLSLQAGLVAIQQGAATIAGGVQLVHDGIGDGTEFDADGNPKTVQAGMVALSGGVGTLADGIAQIVTGLGQLESNGHAKKEVTKRTTRFGNTVEEPATVLWGIESAQTAITDKFVAGVNQILDALGDPNVSASTILFGLKQLSDGVGQAAAGSNEGAAGADTLGGVLASTASGQDVAAALQQAAIERAESYRAFTEKPDARTEGRVVFVIRTGAI